MKAFFCRICFVVGCLCFMVYFAGFCVAINNLGLPDMFFIWCFGLGWGLLMLADKLSNRPTATKCGVADWCLYFDRTRNAGCDMKAVFLNSIDESPEEIDAIFSGVTRTAVFLLAERVNELELLGGGE